MGNMNWTKLLQDKQIFNNRINSRENKNNNTGTRDVMKTSITTSVLNFKTV